jgi:hypothetical protein
MNDMIIYLLRALRELGANAYLFCDVFFFVMEYGIWNVFVMEYGVWK